MKNRKALAVGYAIAAAVFYALNTPLSKLLLRDIPPTFMAAFLYLGAGAGVGVMYAFHWKKEAPAERLSKKDLPYTLGMILLDILAPILLMLGLSTGSAANASLLGNFEIVATTLIALVLFGEKVSGKLWLAIALITLSSAMLSFEGSGSFSFSAGSLLVVLATCCWGLENNCTRRISEKSTYQIVTVKGLCSGTGALIVSLVIGERFPAAEVIVYAMLLGYVAYGLSIFTYVRAQRDLGAAKTSAYYAVAPFIAALLSVFITGDALSLNYAAAFAVMAAGTVFVVMDTFVNRHRHLHNHTVTHTHGGVTHTHVITHDHSHIHIADSEKHGHTHTEAQLLRELEAQHGKETEA